MFAPFDNFTPLCNSPVCYESKLHTSIAFYTVINNNMIPYVVIQTLNTYSRQNQIHSIMRTDLATSAFLATRSHKKNITTILMAQQHYQAKEGSKGLAIVLAEDNYEDLELHYPRLRLKEAGYDVQVVGPKKGHTYTSKHGYWAPTTLTFSDVDPASVKVLVVPGGFCTDRLRRYPECCTLTNQIWNAGAVVGFICHGGWLPISAKIVKGRKVTSFPAIKDDLINAGCDWVDEKCVVDGKMVTAQTPEDLPAFMTAILNALH